MFMPFGGYCNNTKTSEKKVINLTANSHRYLSNHVYSLIEMLTLDTPDNYL